MEQKYEKGNLVRLKSGGPLMVVIGYKMSQAGDAINYALGRKEYPSGPIATSWVLCEWMDGSKRKTQYFEEANLELVETTS